jgi:hypothetical protein
VQLSAHALATWNLKCDGHRRTRGSRVNLHRALIRGEPFSHALKTHSRSVRLNVQEPSREEFLCRHPTPQRSVPAPESRVGSTRSCIPNDDECSSSTPARREKTASSKSAGNLPNLSGIIRRMSTPPRSFSPFTYQSSAAGRPTSSNSGGCNVKT